MTYLNTNARTTSPTANESFRPLGRTSTLFGVFLGYVKRSNDVQRMGRLSVWIPELGSAPENEEGWITASYCSPFAGATNVNTTSVSDLASFEGTQTSYGMWMVPPDIDNQVLVMFINGESHRAIWFGVLYNQFTNHMVPGMASSSLNYQYPGKHIPVAEYNKWDQKVTQPDNAVKPFEKTKFKGIGNQGLVNDRVRGTTNSSARRESPSEVFGIITPGPKINSEADPKVTRRKGGSSFIMDDAVGSEYVQLVTKSGAQININETNGFVYIINRDGTAWVQMDQTGNIDIFGANNISMRAQRDFNIRADRNINIEAGQNIFMKAAQDTVEETTTFTYDVNNVPKPSTIPVWNYVGEGNGQGGNIVMQALNNWQSTTRKSAYLTVTENNLSVKIGNTLNVTTKNGGQNFSSKQGVKITTDAALDVAATGNIRIGSKGSVNVIGAGDVILCTDSNISLNSSNNIINTAANLVSLNSMAFNVGTTLNVNNLVYGGLNSGSSDVPTLNPIAAQGALSAPPAQPAEVKPLNDKLNILATWQDPESKFKRNSKPWQTTVSRLPTYEPCPEHERFKPNTVAGNAPTLTVDDKTYQGSSGAGNNVNTAPAPYVGPGADNTTISGDPAIDSDISKDINLAALRCQLIIHEGLVNKSYYDTTGLLHGGIGHLLRTNEIPLYPKGTPISDDQINTWYRQDSLIAIRIAQNNMGSKWSDLSDIRKRAIIDLSYNLGSKISQFSQFLSAMKAGDYNRAGQELKNSKWYAQVGRRGPNIVTMVVNNIDPNRCDKKFPG